MSERKNTLIWLSEGLTDEEFGKLLDPYAVNDMPEFEIERAAKGAVDFIDENWDVLSKGVDLLTHRKGAVSAVRKGAL
ncbi:MAG: hypothetical protein HQL45_03725 [Alphaproteobacteria bacterium]|nr:hypothetical protein [Alphaproteobacteria bacterium]